MLQPPQAEALRAFPMCPAACWELDSLQHVHFTGGYVLRFEYGEFPPKHMLNSDCGEVGP
jgi:hypothetical protein